MTIPSTVEFVRKWTAKFDESHGLEHALYVAANVAIISKTLAAIKPDDLEIMTVAALMHDLRDHKYADNPDIVSETDMRSHIDRVFYSTETTNLIMHIIGNMSWSKERAGKNVPITINLKHELMRRIVQDADWLEAIGEVGIRRCITYNTVILGSKNIERDVCAHIRVKLCHIPDALHTAAARRMAADRAIYVLTYLIDHEPK